MYVLKFTLTTLQKHEMRKTIVDACYKSVFLFNSKFYKQVLEYLQIHWNSP